MCVCMDVVVRLSVNLHVFGMFECVCVLVDMRLSLCVCVYLCRCVRV